jgi:hypothetical protein
MAPSISRLFDRIAALYSASCSPESSYLFSCSPPHPDHAGVMGIDFATCDLEYRLYQSNPGIEQQPAWPEETKFPGCKCAEKFVYKGQEYSECIEQDWSVAWCGTVDCGIQAPTVTDTGWWADCKPFGVRAELENLLLASGQECKLELMNECQIEALRSEGSKCSRSGSTCPKTKVDAEEAANFFNGLSGSQFRSDTSQSSWASNAGPTELDPTLSDSADSCPICENEQMRPQCAVPKRCGKSGLPIENRERKSQAGSMVVGRLHLILSSLLLAVAAAVQV